MTPEQKETLAALRADLEARRPLEPEETASLRNHYRVLVTYTSNALEGNSLTESETKVILEDGLTIGGKPLRDHLEAEGHARAYAFMWELAKKLDITEKDVLRLHALFYEKIDSANAGRYRTVRTFISGTRYVPPNPARVPDAMRELAAAIPAKRGELHPVDFAAWLHLRFVLVHPFVDDNGRTARLVMNLALIQAGYPLAVIRPEARAQYIRVLAECSEAGVDEPFFELIAQAEIDSFREYLRLLDAASAPGAGDA